jgi:hypothetical protein
MRRDKTAAETGLAGGDDRGRVSVERLAPGEDVGHHIDIEQHHTQLDHRAIGLKL